MKKLNLFLIITAIILILDGILSILFQLNEDLMYHLPRITRLLIGLYILLVGFLEIKVEIGISDSYIRFELYYKLAIVLIGIILIFDAIISIIVQFNEPIYMQIGRYVRGGIGISYILIGIIVILKDKEIFKFEK